MGRPPKDPMMAGAYATRAKGWLVCDTCNRSIPYAGNPDSSKGDGWPLHRCEPCRLKAMPFDRYTTDDPNPPIDVSHLWDFKPAPEQLIG